MPNTVTGFEKWLPKWRSNGFRTADGNTVKNVGIIKYLSALLEERGRRGQQVRLQYVKGHSNDSGNDGADAQANIGTTLPPRPDLDWTALKARASETIDTLIQPMDGQTANTREIRPNTADAGLSTERPAKMPKNSVLPTESNTSMPMIQ